MKNKIKLVAFDLDGTITQHKSPLEEENKLVLEKLSKKYKLLMVGAGGCQRIFNQLLKFPIDVIGNYGLQYGEYNEKTGELDIKTDLVFDVDRESVTERISALREKFGFNEYVGESVEFHASGCVTFPIIGTEARLADKLAFDPDRSRRRAIHQVVKDTFPDYTVFVGGTSSFDMSPAPYDKAYALSKYCADHGIRHDEVVYAGDDYGIGGNDESVYVSDIKFICVDDYTRLDEYLAEL